MSFSTRGIFCAGYKRLLLGLALPQAGLLVVLSPGSIQLPALLVAFGSQGITLQHLPSAPASGCSQESRCCQLGALGGD